nr:MAG TPA: hypothetical protein [Caudoviricetes sp.]
MCIIVIFFLLLQRYDKIINKASLYCYICINI